ncbi:MAG: hypothetical protein K0U37_08155 [Gammaproteobacteria bacterium]|nr:hypothetical protein [Gammaproteobacteria bacterium]
MALTDNDIMMITATLTGYISNMPAESAEDLQALVNALRSLEYGGSNVVIETRMQAGIQAIREYMLPESGYSTPENRSEFNFVCHRVVTERIRHFEAQQRQLQGRYGRNSNTGRSAAIRIPLTTDDAELRGYRTFSEQAFASAHFSGIVDGMYLESDPRVIAQMQLLEFYVCFMFLVCSTVVARNNNMSEQAQSSSAQQSLSSMTSSPLGALSEFYEQTANTVHTTPAGIRVLSFDYDGCLDTEDARRRALYRQWQIWRDVPRGVMSNTDAAPVVEAELVSTEVLATATVLNATDTVPESEFSTPVARPVSGLSEVIVPAILIVVEHPIHRSTVSTSFFFQPRREEHPQEHPQVEELSDNEGFESGYN